GAEPEGQMAETRWRFRESCWCGGVRPAKAGTPNGWGLAKGGTTGLGRPAKAGTPNGWGLAEGGTTDFGRPAVGGTPNGWGLAEAGRTNCGSFVLADPHVRSGALVCRKRLVRVLSARC